MRRMIMTLLLCFMLALVNSTPSFADVPEEIEQWIDRIENDFLEKKYIDMDGKYRGQCVDLAFFYAAEIFAQEDFRQTINRGNANRLYANASSDYFEKLPYSPDTELRVGDLVLWDHSRGGHVAIIMDVSDQGITVLEQNMNGRGTAPVSTRFVEGPDYAYFRRSRHPMGYLRPIREQLKNYTLTEQDQSKQEVNLEV